MKVTKSRGNVFADIGLDEIEAEELAVKSDLVTLINRTVRLQRLTQTEAAKLCGVDQPTLSKVLNGRLSSVTIDRLAKWLVALGHKISISVSKSTPVKTGRKGEITVHAD